MSNAPGMVAIVHKETGLTSVVPESTVPAWQTAGWSIAEGSEAETASTPLDQVSSTPTPEVQVAQEQSQETAPENGTEESGQQPPAE